MIRAPTRKPGRRGEAAERTSAGGFHPGAALVFVTSKIFRLSIQIWQRLL